MLPSNILRFVSAVLMLHFYQSCAYVTPTEAEISLQQTTHILNKLILFKRNYRAPVRVCVWCVFLCFCTITQKLFDLRT